MKRELDSRTNSQGDRVALLWDPRFDRVEIEVENRETGVVLWATVPAGSARDAFEHPFLYLPAEPALALVA